jgi:hypothetical protein
MELWNSIETRVNKFTDRSGDHLGAKNQAEGGIVIAVAVPHNLEKLDS